MLTHPIAGSGRVGSGRRFAATIIAAGLMAACGPKVEPVETARVMERDEDGEVLVFVRDADGIPPCPWEVLGSIEVEDGWTEDEGDLRDVKRAAAKLGGHAVMTESVAADRVRVLRFFDPLCNPLSDGD